MYNLFKNVIVSKNYELSNMLKKIDTKWIDGTITDDQRAELLDLARGNAVPENSYADMQKQMQALMARVGALEEVVKTLKGDASEETTEEYPEYVQPLGAHDAYHNGDKVTYNGVKYTCIAPDGVAVVWSPDVMPNYWQKKV